MLVKVKDGKVEMYPYTIGDLRRDNPNMSFPEMVSTGELATFGVYPCEPVPEPTVDHTKNIEEGTPNYDGSSWKQTWIVSDASPEEINQRVTQQWANVRDERNEKLSSSDWTQLPDAPVNSEAWATYRHALREITTQEDPFNIVWPIEPTNK